MNDFGEFLYTLRKEKGMTQAHLANLLGVTNKAVSKWETGEAMPETSLLLPLSRILGVTVDELLEGKRNDNNNTNEFESQQPNEDSSEKNSFKDKDADDELIEEYIRRQIFKRGKDDDKTTLEKVSGLVCSCVFFIGVLTYLIMGSIGNLWTPYWILIPISALASGIVGIIFDLCNSKKRNHKIARGEKPYVGAICGVIMLLCIITYLILGVFFSLWNPFWLIIVIGAFVCTVIGTVGGIFSNKNNKND